MNNQDLQNFLNIIDGRIKKCINENKLLKQYCGVVVEEVSNSKSTKYKVRLLGDNTIFTFLNKTGEVLSRDDYVYIQTVGTDLSTGVIMYRTKESTVPIIPSDFIVDQGETDNWHYRKWNNGTAECWRIITYTTAVDESYENIFVSSKTSPLSPIDYPFSFKQIPMEYCVCNSGSAGVMVYETANTTTKTSQYIIWRGTTSAENTYKLSLFVTGKWK